MVDGYVMRAQKISSPTETVYWAVIDSPDYNALLSEYDPADLSLPATIDYTFETAVDGLAGSPSGFAGGDLSGQYPNPKVVKINGRPVADINPDDGYVLTWKNLRWEPRPQNAPEFLPPNRVVTSNALGKLSANIPLPGSAKPFAVFMEKPIGSMAFDKLTEDMVDPGFLVTTTDLVYVVGQTVTDPLFTVNVGEATVPPSNISYNRTTVSSGISDSTGNALTFLDNLGNIVTDINGLSSFKIQGTFSGLSNQESSKIFTVTANDGVKTTQKQVKINWFFNFYYGVGPDWSSFTTNASKVNFVRGNTMTPVLTNNKSRDISVNCGESQYIYYAYPSVYGDAEFSFNGVSGGFTKIDTIFIQNTNDPSGTTQPYSVWQSNNPDLGNITISCS